MYRLKILRRAQKEMARLPKKYEKRMKETIQTIRENPLRGKKMEGEFDGCYSYRVWPYRVMYAIEKKTVTVIIVRIGHRMETMPELPMTERGRKHFWKEVREAKKDRGRTMSLEEFWDLVDSGKDV